MRRDDHGVEAFSRSLITHNGVRPVSARTVDWGAGRSRDEHWNYGTPSKHGVR
jgi:hypothetical protein